MDFKEAINKVEEGKAVQRKCWHETTFLTEIDGVIEIYPIQNNLRLDIEDIKATDWTIFNGKDVISQKAIDELKIEIQNNSFEMSNQIVVKTKIVLEELNKLKEAK